MKLWSGFMTTAGWDSNRRLGEMAAEARWLLDVARGIGTTHVVVITELAGTNMQALDLLVAEIRARSMVPVLWTSKAFAQPWRHAEGLSYVRSLAQRFPGVLFDIGREADFLWQIHNRPENEVVGLLWQIKAALIAEGVAGENIMAGGHTLTGAISLDRIGPGWVTVTGYAWIDKAFALNPGQWSTLLAGVVRDELVELRARTDPAHRICVAEIGWPSGLPGNGGAARQAIVYRETLRGIAESDVVDGVGYWQLIDFPHCVDTEGNMSGNPRCTPEACSYGLVGADGLPRPAFNEMMVY